MLSVYLNLDKRFAFIELRTMPEAAAALQMDGVLFRGMSLRMRRPNDYNPIAFPPVSPPVRSSEKGSYGQSKGCRGRRIRTRIPVPPLLESDRTLQSIRAGSTLPHLGRLERLAASKGRVCSDRSDTRPRASRLLIPLCSVIKDWFQPAHSGHCLHASARRA